MKVAIVGSGISGLTASYILGKAGHDVELFEYHDMLGMDAHSVDVNGCRLDTPPRSINADYYTNLLQVYRDAGIELEPFCWDFSFSEVNDSKQLLFMCLATVFGKACPVKAQSLWSAFHVVNSALKLYRNMSRDLLSTHVQDMDFGTWLKSTGPYSPRYVQLCLLPALATWFTASYEAVLRYPAVLVMEFLKRHSMSANYHTKHGSCDAVAKLSKYVSKVHLSSTVTAIHVGDSVEGSKPSLSWTCKESGTTKTAQFDAVIVATEATSAGKLLVEANPKLLAALASIPHEKSEVVIHKDPSLMPAKRSQWMPANFGSDLKRKEGSCTLWFEIPGSSETNGKPWSLFQTWNPLQRVQDDAVVSRYSFERPMVTLATSDVVKTIWSHQGEGGIYVIGAYTNFTVPLQESAVVSALRVCAALGNAPAWFTDEAAAHPCDVPYTTAHVAAIAAAAMGMAPVPSQPPPLVNRGALKANANLIKHVPADASLHRSSNASASTQDAVQLIQASVKAEVATASNVRSDKENTNGEGNRSDMQQQKSQEIIGTAGREGSGLGVVKSYRDGARGKWQPSSRPAWLTACITGGAVKYTTSG